MVKIISISNFTDKLDNKFLTHNEFNILIDILKKTGENHLIDIVKGQTRGVIQI